MKETLLRMVGTVGDVEVCLFVLCRYGEGTYPGTNPIVLPPWYLQRWGNFGSQGRVYYMLHWCGFFRT